MSERLDPKKIAEIIKKSSCSGSIRLTGTREERKEQLRKLREKDLSTNTGHFNFDLEKMEKSLNSDFVEVPDNLDSFEEFELWLKNTVKEK